jgi:nucleoid-associated protein YgaU
MGFPHTVRRGDSLWNLAGRYLGNRFPAARATSQPSRFGG